MYSLPVRHEALLAEPQPHKPPALRHVDRLVEAAASAGKIRNDVPVDLVCGQVHAAIETSMREWAAGQVAEPYARLDQLDLVFGGALASRRGRR